MSNQISIIKQPLYGSVIWDGTNFVYTPKTGFSGTDYYMYSITDGLTSQIKTNYVNTVNQPPSAGDISLSVDASQIAYINVNNYANDPDNLIHTLKIVELSKTLYGIAAFNDNIISYQPNGFNAKEIFTYKISDGQYSSIGKIEINITNGINSQIPDYILNSLSSLEHGVTNISTQSGGWNDSYTLLSSKSAAWDSITPARYNAVSNIVESYSADWNSMGDNKDAYINAYNLVQTKSADWNNTIVKISTITNIYSSDSAKWESSYNLLCGTSATWDKNVQDTLDVTSFFNTNSSTWKNTYLFVSSNSGNWDKVPLINLLNSNSANWVNTYVLLSSNSGKWEDSYVNIIALSSLFYTNSSNWDSTYALVCAKSATWDAKSIVSHLTANSGNWENSYSILCSNSAKWNQNITDFNSLSTNYSNNSGKWNTTYNTVCASSSTWDTTPLFSYLGSNSGNWQNTYNTVTANSSSWNSLYGSFSALSSDYVSNSANWNSAYATVYSTSATWDITDINAYLAQVSSNWNSSYNTVTAGSAGWNSVGGLFSNLSSNYIANSGNWQTVYNLVCANSTYWDVNEIFNLLGQKSAFWDASYSIVTAGSAGWDSLSANFNALSSNYNSNSGNWNNAYNLVTGNSANWNYSSIATTVQINSADWIATYSVLSSNSGKWNTAYNNVSSLTNDFASKSGAWQSAYVLVSGNSGSWGDKAAFTALTSNSGKWTTAYNTVCANSSTWNNVSSFYAKYDSAYNILSTNSSNWDNTYNIINPNSGKWESTYSTVNTNSAKWLSGGIDVDITTNNLIVSGNAVFYGSLTAEGDTTQLNTEIVATSSFAVVNTGFVDAFRVTKTQTTGAIADFNTNGVSVMYVSPNNKVGINTNSPSEALTVVGNISATGSIIGARPSEYTVFINNSTNYDTAFTYVSQTSASINALTAAKGSYDTAYSYVTANSASFNTIVSNDPLYSAAFNVVSSQSALNTSSYTFLTANSSNIGTDTVYRSLSSKYEEASTYVSTITSAQAQINFIFDGGGAVIDSGSFGMVQIPYRIAITSWTILADVPTTATIQVLSSNYSSHPVYTLISGSTNAPIINGSTKAANASTLTDWLSVVNADSILRFRLVSNNSATSITLSLKCTRY